MAEKVILIDSDSSQLKKIREEFHTVLVKAGFDEKTREEMQVALGEACANCMRHAYSGEAGHEIRITIQDGPEKIVFKIRDFGKKIDLSKVEKPQLPPTKPHGLGIYFMQTIMDTLEYNTSHPEGNEVILTKYKKGAPQ